MNIDELKKDWKSQKTPKEDIGIDQNLSSRLDEFQQIQRKTRLNNVICSILFVCSIIFLWCVVYFMQEASWWVYSGILVLSVEMVLGTGFAWYRTSLKKADHLRVDSYSYITKAIKKLLYRKVFLRYIIPVYSLMLLTGINMVYVDVLSDFSITWQLMIHFGVSLAIVFFVGIEFWKRLKKQRNEIDPMIIDLQIIKERLE